MDCCGRRDKAEEISKEQLWDWLNLSDFRSHSCITPLSYGILYISLLISIACYGVDLFTAINLLVRNTWSGIVKPAIPISISRWIFAGCIILSWILLVYRWLRAVRAMRTGGVAQSYLDPLAVRIQSIRMGKRGRGWRRFLVFAELTKNKKGSEYIALFCHYSFEAWLRILFAEGPRNAINAMTLYSVMQANVIPTGIHAANSGQSPILQFFSNLATLAESNRTQAAVLLGMLFTLVIWVISFLSLAVACICYVLFLWHHIPSQDGGLYSYCKRKVDRRLQKIVGIKVNKALAKETLTNSREDSKTGNRPLEMKRQPTLPVLNTDSSDKLPEMPTLSRKTSEATLPPYTSRPPTRNDGSVTGLDKAPTIPDISFDPRRPAPPSRANTQFSQASKASFGSNAPLLSSAGPMGYGPVGRTYSPGPLSRTDSDRTMDSEGVQMMRGGTNNPQTSFGSNQSAWGPPKSAQGRSMGPPIRQNTMNSDFQFQGRPNPGPLTRQNTAQSDFTHPGPPTRQNTAQSNFTPQGPLTRQNTAQSDFTHPGPPTRQNTAQSYYTPQGPPGPPSRQNTSNGDYQAELSRSQGRPGPPSRQDTGMNAYDAGPLAGSTITLVNSQGPRNQAQSFLSDPHGRSTPISGRENSIRSQPYEMRSEPPPQASNVMRPPTSEGRYIPYNPNVAINMRPPLDTSGSSQPHRDFTPSPTHRNFSAPLRSARQPEYFNQQRQPPQRSGTAPLPNLATYDDSIYDIYGDEEEEQNSRPLQPLRAATASPGGRGWGYQSGYRSNASNIV